MESPYIFAICFFALLQLTQVFTDSKNLERKQFFVAPPQYINHLHFGYAEPLADSMWIRAIQDFDFCQNPSISSPKSEGEILPSKVAAQKDVLEIEIQHLMKEITTLNKDVKSCRNGWLSRMLDSVTELSPRFKIVYLFGGTSLSVVINDFEGASHIFNKGIRQFPDDWRLPYHAAYHFMYDRQDLARAAELLQKAVETGAPPWVHSLAARAYTASGQGELAIRMLTQFRQFTKNELRDEVDQRIERIKKALLNNKEN